MGLPVGVGGSGDARHREVAAADGVGDIVVPQVEDHPSARCFETHVLAVALEPGDADVLVVSDLAESMIPRRARIRRHTRPRSAKETQVEPATTM